MLKGVYFIIFSQRGQRNYVWPWFIFIHVGRWTNNRLCEVHAIDACLWLIFFCAQSETSIRMSPGTVSLTIASQGFSCPFSKTFAAVFPDPTDRRWVSEDAFGGKGRTSGQSRRKRQTERGIGSGKGRLPFPLPRLSIISLYRVIHMMWLY